MKTNQIQESEQKITTLMVKSVIGDLIKLILPQSISRRSLIINNLSPSFKLRVEENFFVMVIGNLINEMIIQTKDECLRIENPNENTISLSVKNNKLAMNRPFLIFLDNLKIISKRMGSDVYFENFEKSGSELSVSFYRKAA